MGSQTRQLRNNYYNSIINQALLNGETSVTVKDEITRKRVLSQAKRRNFDLEKFTVKVQDQEEAKESSDDD